MTSKPVLVIGARSDMALATAHKFAGRGHPIQLAARNAQSLEAERADIALRYNVEVTLHELDILDTASHGPFLDALPEMPRIAICAVGLMGTQDENAANMEAAAAVMRSNFEGPASLFGLLANAFEARGSGTLVGISSVAGERGRATNYIYGAAKAGFTAYLSGLRNRLASQGVHVVTVLPGFVDTKMTADLDLPEKLTAQPSEVADAIEAAVRTGKNVIYVRKIWWLVMAIIRNIPEAIFKKMKL